MRNSSNLLRIQGYGNCLKAQINSWGDGRGHNQISLGFMYQSITSRTPSMLFPSFQTYKTLIGSQTPARTGYAVIRLENHHPKRVHLSNLYLSPNRHHHQHSKPPLPPAQTPPSSPSPNHHRRLLAASRWGSGRLHLSHHPSRQV
jgi:hypothetical protein